MVIVDEEFKTKSLKRITYYIYSLLLALKMHLEKKIKKKLKISELPMQFFPGSMASAFNTMQRVDSPQ